MVARRAKASRFAFTLIELIFAIVVISIAVISLPVMTQITSKGIESNILQEAIFAASTELMGATSYYWDLNSMQDNSLSHLSRVIDIGTTCENNTSSPRHRLRPGHIAQPLHRRCLDSNATTAADTNSSLFPNLNNAAHSGADAIFDNPAAEAAGYKDTYTSDVNVTRVNNIKFITVTVQNSDGDPIVVLRTQSANVGEIDYYKRRF